jgi:hypothetical protein
LFSANYLNDQGILLGADYDRVTLRTNNEYRVAKFLKLGNVLTADIVRSDNKPNGVFTDAYRASPAAPLKDSTGNYGYQPGIKCCGNPVANIELTNDFTNDLRLQGNLYAELTILKGLTFRSAWGFDHDNSDNTAYDPVYNYGTYAHTVSELFVENSQRFYWVSDNILNYRNRFGEHSVELTLGHTAERDKGNNTTLRATNVPPERNLWYITQGDPMSPMYPIEQELF